MPTDNIAFCNTKEGMHIKAKELNLKAYSLGCSCYDCCKEFEEIMTSKPDVIKAAFSVGKQEESVLYKEVWNAAIEAVINNVECYEWQLDKIRKLKK